MNNFKNRTEKIILNEIIYIRELNVVNFRKINDDIYYRNGRH